MPASKSRISLHIAGRLLNTPLMVQSSYLSTLIGSLQGRGLPVVSLNDGDIVLDSEQLSAMADSYSNPRGTNMPYQVKGGVAYIPLSGSLVHKLGTLKPYSGMTGYDGIRANIDLALADPNVKAIALDTDSPGGEVSGCFALCDYIYANVRGKKPIWALVNELACSACYAIAASCERVIVTETAIAGSVGVICAHTDMSKAIEDAGFKITLFYAGDKKADGNPYNPLSTELSAEIQAEMAELHQYFSNKVATWRGVDVQSVLGTQSATFRGQAIVDIGFADALMSADEFHQELINHAAKSGTQKPLGALKMTEEEKAAAAAAAELAAKASADVATAVKAENERVLSILGCDEAKSRPKLANALASTPGMTLEQAKAMLAVAGEEKLDAGGQLEQLMQEHGEKPLGDDSVSTPEKNELAEANSLLDRAFGKKK